MIDVQAMFVVDFLSLTTPSHINREESQNAPLKDVWSLVIVTLGNLSWTGENSVIGIRIEAIPCAPVTNILVSRSRNGAGSYKFVN